MKKRERRFIGHVVSHTHWDRAWYWPFQAYRIRLVQLIDDLIEILVNNPDYKSFTLDGQTVILEDYLEVKPQNKEILTQLIKDKRIYIGPWYVLPDEFIISAESLVRNLLLGNSIASEFGNVMNEGYVPDPFGHIAQLPQVLNGFGINSFIFFRGYGLDLDKVGTEFIWKAPDGSEVLAIYEKNSYGHFSCLGFDTIWGNFKNIKPDEKKALERLTKQFEDLSKYANTEHILFSNGCDHVPPQKELPDLLKYLNKNQNKIKVIHSNFPDLIKSIKPYKDTFKSFSGELISGKYDFILLGVYSTRMYLKQLNYYNQNLYEKYVEPISIFNRLNGGYNYHPLVWTGWKLILKNHPHDDICGAGVDAIHKDMENRYKQATEIGEYIVKHAFEEFSSSINTSSIPDSKPIIVFNPNSWTSSDYIFVDLLFNPDDQLSESFKIIDKDGNEYKYNILSSELFNTVEILKEVTYKKVKIALLVSNVFGVGYKTLYIVKGKQKNEFPFKAKKSQIENKFFVISVNKNGSINIFDKRSNAFYFNLNLFEDTEDIGDEYTYSYCKKSKTITSSKAKAKIKINQNNVYSEIRVSLNLKIPEQISSNRNKRSNKLISLPIKSIIRLGVNSERIDISTTVVNEAKDHRLRVLFPTGISTNKCIVDDHFYFIERDAYYPNKPTFDNRFEYYGTRNQQKFVSISDKKVGITIANKGLPEYEILENKGNSIIALTLFRSVGWLSRNDLITRPRNAGPVLKTPDAQCLGTHTFEYSIIPHQHDVIQSRAYIQAYLFNSPLLGFNVSTNNKGILPDSLKLISVDSDKVILSAVKKSEKGDNLIVRLFNPINETINLNIELYKMFKNVSIENLKEETIEKLKETDNNVINIDIKPFKIITLLFQF